MWIRCDHAAASGRAQLALINQGATYSYIEIDTAGKLSARVLAAGSPTVDGPTTRNQ